MSHKSRFVTGQPRELSKWIALLSRFNNGHPLKKDIISKIEDFFEYSWTCNRLNAVKSKQDQRFMEELPESTKCDIFIDYLFADFLCKYDAYFFQTAKNSQHMFS